VALPTFTRVCKVDNDGNVVVQVGIEYAGEEVDVTIRLPEGTSALEQPKEIWPPPARENERRQERRESIG
jgi:hypothetical protein